MTKIDSAIQQWRCLNSPLLREAYIVDIFPQLSNTKTEVSLDIRRNWELPYGERTVIASVCRAVNPRLCFEIGTYSGTTTALISDSAGEKTVVHTLELPAEALGAVDKEIGTAFRDKKEYANRIVQHRGDSKWFDFSPYFGQIDLVYIDGSHKFHDVINDSRVALKMLAPGGYIIWDDYAPNCHSVMDAIDFLASEMPIVRIFSTRLAFYGPRL